MSEVPTIRQPKDCFLAFRRTLRRCPGFNIDCIRLAERHLRRCLEEATLAPGTTLEECVDDFVLGLRHCDTAFKSPELQKACVQGLLLTLDTCLTLFERLRPAPLPTLAECEQIFASKLPLCARFKSAEVQAACREGLERFFALCRRLAARPPAAPPVPPAPPAPPEPAIPPSLLPLLLLPLVLVLLPELAAPPLRRRPDPDDCDAARQKPGETDHSTR